MRTCRLNILYRSSMAMESEHVFKKNKKTENDVQIDAVNLNINVK